MLWLEGFCDETTSNHYNPDLAVGPDNKQRWNQPAHRRHGFHNAHNLFRRSKMVRSRNVLVLEPASKQLTQQVPELSDF